MIVVHRMTKKEWEESAESAHLAVFKETKPASQERIDFALLAVEGDNVLTYVTCKEISPDTLYWSYGGAFPPSSGTPRVWASYRACTEKCWAMGYKTIFTLIENSNRTMLKMAAKLGYVIVGVRHVDGFTMLDHRLERP